MRAAPDPEALTLLAELILSQEAGIVDGSLIAAGGYAWPRPQAGTVPSFGEILTGLREDARRDPFWDDSGVLDDVAKQPMTQAQTNEVAAAIKAARAAGRTVIAVEFPRSLALAQGPWSIGGVELVFHSWYTDGFNLKLAGTGAFLYDDEFHRFGESGAA
jgi:Asp-tRNA(Asn)/Glu-tRNA(Gln) amidotransferase A subunit family amidase